MSDGQSRFEHGGVDPLGPSEVPVGEDGLGCQGEDDADDQGMDAQGDAHGEDDAGHEPEPEEPGPDPAALEAGVGDSQPCIGLIVDGHAEPDQPAQVRSPAAGERRPRRQELVVGGDVGGHGPDCDTAARFRAGMVGCNATFIIREHR